MPRLTFSFDDREKLAYTIVAAIVVVLMIGLVKLQVFQHRDLSLRSETNRLRVVPIVPRRGLVSDRDGDIIIDNRPSYTVSVVMTEQVKDVTLPNLSRLLGIDSAQIVSRIKKNLVSPYQPTPVMRDIPFEIVAVLEEQAKQFPGVVYQMEQVRQYREHFGAECFTGHVGEVSDEELRSSGSNYRLGSMIGKKGLERQFDQLMRGVEGTAYIEVSAPGQILGHHAEREPTLAVPGSNLTLTIDDDLQLTAARLLDTFCCGAIVAIDPRTGSILAMTSYPTFDANIFSSVIPDSLWQEIRADSSHPLLNRPLNGQYPPGSTVKFVAIGAGLELGLITPSSTFKSCRGGMQFGNRFFRCWRHEGHGTLVAAEALEQSCDVYLYQLGLKLGVDELARYYDLCGFGKKTGVDLPNESPGLNPNSEYYDRRYGEKGWTRALVLNNAIGQGELLVTPLQLAQFFGALANDGIGYRPHVVAAITTPDGRRTEVKPEVSLRLPFKPQTLEVLQEGLRRVVEGEHGTARRLRNKYYSIGGKTGTAQNPHGENHSWFVGVAPLDNPQIVVAAIVENAGDGSAVAAPVVGKIIEAYLRPRPAGDTLAAVVMPEVLHP